VMARCWPVVLERPALHSLQTRLTPQKPT